MATHGEAARVMRENQVADFELEPVQKTVRRVYGFGQFSRRDDALVGGRAW
jgi:hypothetical protein